MKKFFKIIIILFAVIIGLTAIWFSLDKITRCKLIYGKNICNFYAMMDIVSHNPENSDFEKAMKLCGEMEDVPKKDGCFEYIAETFAYIDIRKAKLACDEIKGFGEVHTKEDCYSKIQKPNEKELARQIVEKFMIARIQKNQPFAESFLTDNAKEQYYQSGLTLIGVSNPHFANYNVLESKKLDSEGFQFKVRIYEEYTGQDRVGYFDETLIVIKSGDRYLIDSVERGEYIDL